MMKFKEYKKWLGYVKSLKVGKHLSMLPYVIVKPNTFFEYYDNLSSQGKIWQFITYVLLQALCIYTFTSTSIKDIAQSQIIDNIISFKWASIVILVTLIIKSELQEKVIFKSVLFFIYTKIIFMITQLLLYKTFMLSEDYFFLFLYQLITVIILPYIIIAIPLIFYTKIKQRIIFYGSCFVMFNIFIFLLYSYDPSSLMVKNLDLITQERYEFGRKIKNTYIIPTVIVESENNLSHDHYMYSEVWDNKASRTYNDEQFIKELRIDIDSLNAIIEQCQFRINQNFFRCLHEIKRGILYTHINKRHSGNIFKETFIMRSDSTKIDKLIYRDFNNDISKMNNELFEEELKSYERYKTIMQVNRINYLFFPILYYLNNYKSENITLQQ